MKTYQTVSLSAIDHAVEDIQDLEPKTQHAVFVRELVEVAKEDLAKQGRRLHSGLAHPDRVGMVGFRLQQSQNEGKEDLIEYGGPFAFVARDKLD